ncbi:MAG: hypothetical protein DRP64_00485 [Verrucomicrobia bacterium]|nr:MAG: hypothetical protein DRP64_00485 [Verrucomicrobiota bacterium]
MGASEQTKPKWTSEKSAGILQIRRINIDNLASKERKKTQRKLKCYNSRADPNGTLGYTIHLL